MKQKRSQQKVNSKLSVLEKQAVARRRDAGELISKLAIEFKVTTNTIRKIVLEQSAAAGVAQKIYGITDEQALEVVRLIEAGESQKAVAKALAITPKATGLAWKQARLMRGEEIHDVVATDKETQDVIVRRIVAGEIDVYEASHAMEVPVDPVVIQGWVRKAVGTSKKTPKVFSQEQRDEALALCEERGIEFACESTAIARGSQSI